MNSRYRIIPLTFLLSCLFLASCGPEQKAATTVPATQATAPALPPSPPPPAPRPAHGPSAATAQPAETVEHLITRAEAEYARGQANYSAGHMEAAKDNFDAAFNLLLRGPIGLQNDEKLQGEFDKIVEATHELELQALKVGDGFTEQKAEPAPIDVVNDITFPVDPSIKAKAQAELTNTHSDLPLMLTDPVVSYINYFSSRGHGTIERALIRRGRYNEMISRVFREEGVPQDLVFLAQAESGFQPLALSRMGARGMWQFMPWDGTHMGLQYNWWVDERQDPEKATRAAARLLKDLYNQFGDWYLAMAAYNSGPGTVQRAVQRTGYADFWELYRRNVLPGETRNYVPIILAMTIMAKNPTQYGLDHLALDSPTLFDTVRIHYPIDLRLVAECTDSSTAVLQELNPSLLRMTTPKDMDFDLHVPHGTADKFQKAVTGNPGGDAGFLAISPGRKRRDAEPKSRAATTHDYGHCEANNLEETELARDSKLIIPVSPVKASSVKASPVESEPHASSVGYSKHPTRYTVRKGDTILSVADDFGVPAEKVRLWNHIKGNTLRSGRSLTIFKSATGATVERTSETSIRRQSRPTRAQSKAERGPHAPSKSAGKEKGRSKIVEKSPAAESHSAKKEKVKDTSRSAPSKSKKHKQRG